MFCTVRINTEDQKGEKFVGTGFLFGKRVDEKHAQVYVVTNKHIVENQIKGEIHFNKDKDGIPDLTDNLCVPMSNFKGHWHNHPDSLVDVSIMQFGIIQTHVKKHELKILERFIDSKQIPNDVEYSELDAFEELLFIGYPEGLYDEKNNTPIMRKGSSATPIVLDYNGERKFLIDGPIFPGSSGSPVFIHSDGLLFKDGKFDGWIRKIYFVGMISKNFTRVNKGQMVMPNNVKQNKKIPEINENFHLGHVLKPECILETIFDLEEKISRS